MIVPFKQPSTGPVSMKESKEFEAFEENLKKHYYASAIGWLVGLQNVLLQSKDEIQMIREELFEKCGLKIRNTTGWALILFFLEQVNCQYSFYA